MARNQRNPRRGPDPRGEFGRASREKYLLRAFSVPGIVLGSRDTAVSKADKVPALRGFIRVREVQKINMEARK